MTTGYRWRLRGAHDQIAAMLVAGWTQAEVGRHFGVSLSAVHRFCRRYAIERHPGHDERPHVVDIHIYVSQADARAILRWQEEHHSRSFSSAALEMIRASAQRAPGRDRAGGVHRRPRAAGAGSRNAPSEVRRSALQPAGGQPPPEHGHGQATSPTVDQ
jgi:hypothetical protein